MNSHFLMALGRHDSGSVVEAADEALTQIISAVRSTGKTGTITLQVAVKPNGDKGYEVSFDVKSKLPTMPFGRAFYFADENGHLTQDASAVQLELGADVTDIRRAR